MEEYKIALKIAAFLLEYPDENWWKEFGEYRAAAAELKLHLTKSLTAPVKLNSKVPGP